MSQHNPCIYCGVYACMHTCEACYRPLRFDDSIHRARRAAPSEQWCMVCMFAFIVVYRRQAILFLAMSLHQVVMWSCMNSHTLMRVY